MVATMRGAKRRRLDGAEGDTDPQASRIQGKIHHGVREVRKAAKKAKIFETQRLVKKLKTMRTQTPSPPELPDLESQLVTLKTIDIEPVVDYALKNKLKKDKVLSENDHVQVAIASELGEQVHALSDAGTTALKVENRLLSSKALSSEVNALVEALKNILQPQKAPRAVEEDEHEEPERPRKVAKLAPPPRESESSGEGDEEEGDDDGWESGTVLEESEAGDDVGWESGSVDDVPGAAGFSEAYHSSEHVSDDEQSAEDMEGDTPRLPRRAGKGDGKPKEPAPTVKDSKGKTKASGTESTFLPSLAVGYTRGDSDASDIEDEDDAPRKNRRGQRARRAIWEKKFGKNANHVKKQHEVEAANPRQKGNGRQERPSVRPGAATQWNHAGSRTTAAVQRGGSNVKSNRGQGSAQGLPSKIVATEAADKPLHPSWEAKKRLKEKQNPTILPAQGKKIVF